MTYFRCVYLRNLKTSIPFKGKIGVHVFGQIHGNKCNSAKVLHAINMMNSIYI